MSYFVTITNNHCRILGRISLVLSLILMIAFLNVTTGRAQSQVTTLEKLDLELWPDFDRPAVLILLTGTLPSGTDLPATITIPVSAEATINAVARIDTLGNFFTIDYDDSVAGQITVEVPDPVFRLEYYAPYSADGNQRDFSFDWQFDFDVDEVTASIQQPSRASTMNLSPEATSIKPGQYGLSYHSLPPRALPAGNTYRIEGNYELVRPELSAAVVDAQQPSTDSLLQPETSTSIIPESGFNWPLVLAVAGIVLAVVGGVWFVVGRNGRKRKVVKPRPAARATKKPARAPTKGKTASRSNFCHECGEAVGAGDKFCRNCGTALKTG